MTTPDVAGLLDGEPAHDQVVFAARLQRYWPDLLAGLAGAYPDQAVEMAGRGVEIAARSFRQRPEDLRLLDLRRHADPHWHQHPRMLGYAAYADMFAGDLRGVIDKIDYLAELGVTYLHLMPLLKPRPGASDGGYAVMDYRAVRDDLGTVDDLRDLATALRRAGISLTVDLVLNHVATEHAWARAAAAGDHFYRDYFFMFADRDIPDAYERTLPEIFPDFAPGNFTFDDESQAWVWTTFNTWQWDLNWRNPEVFFEFADVICWLANLGVECVRLDAIAFIYKRLGTNCQNQPEVHAITQALRAIARIAAPALIFKAEAIVGPTDLPPYLGVGKHAGRVSDLAYQNSLMVQIWSALAAKDTRLLCTALEPVPGQAAEHGLGHLPALPRRHRLGDRRRRRRGRRAERVRAPAVPVGLLRRLLPDERRPGDGLPGEPRHRGPADQRQRGLADRDRGSPGQRRPRRISTWPSGGCCWRTRSCSGSAGCRCSTWATSWRCATTTTSSTIPATPTTTGGCTVRRWTGRRPSVGTSTGTLEHRVWHGLRNAVTVRSGLPSMDASVETEVMDPVNPAVLVFQRRAATQSMVGLYNVTPDRQLLPRWVVSLGNWAQDALNDESPLSDGDIVLQPYQARWLVQSA